jgi:hypothetical protein
VPAESALVRVVAKVDHLLEYLIQPIPPTMVRFLPTNCASTSFLLTTPPLAFIVFLVPPFLHLFGAGYYLLHCS